MNNNYDSFVYMDIAQPRYFLEFFSNSNCIKHNENVLLYEKINNPMKISSSGGFYGGYNYFAFKVLTYIYEHGDLRGGFNKTNLCIKKLRRKDYIPNKLHAYLKGL